MLRMEHPGLVVRQKSPLNLECQFAALSDWLTPTDQFFVRSHFPSPELDAAEWKLRVGGMVRTPLQLDLGELEDMPRTTLAAVMECAGNGRVFYVPAKEGLQWQTGAVGNASWTGVLLRDVLARAGVKRGAVEVLLVGADKGMVDGGKKTASPGPIAFARSLPLDKALSDSVLLAYAMNGEVLTAEHGHPLRAVVGGWFGMAWVKWITDIHLLPRPFLGYWQARDYFRWDRGSGEPSLVPLSTTEVKAQIARPVSGATVRVGQSCRIFGAAWSGEAAIEAVDVRVRGGAPWQQATLLPPLEPYAWRFWEYHWTPTHPGRHALSCRARDAAGNVQPEAQRADCESYVANWIVPVDIKAVDRQETQAEEFVI
ncbi:MAG: sulfite oxidase [Methylobacteriaceae bacterium]|nr:sulfite oxidase [Methylobacteriaceae bacterium]